jgi:DNA-binding IclR family transcriptional regulator
MLEGNKYSVVLSENSARPFNISSDIGVRVPIPWTATGRLLLGHMNAEAIRTLIPADDFVLDNGVRIDFDEFMRDVQNAKALGYCCTEGLSNAFRLCMAAPVRDRAGIPIAALCFMTGRDTDPERRQSMLDDLLQSAQALSHR